MSARATCGRCSAALPAHARFCPACGAARGEGPAATPRRTVLGIAALFGGTLAAVVAFALMGLDPESPAGMAAYAALLLGVGVAGVLALGSVRWRDTLGGPPAPVDLVRSVAAAALGVAFSWAWVSLLRGLVDVALPDIPTPSLPAAILATAVLPALFEEWLCRGVLWSASRHALGPRATLVATAGVFAVLHGLEGSPAAYPHRFVLGLLAGAVRLRSGSLVPAVVVHLLHNFAFVLAGIE